MKKKEIEQALNTYYTDKSLNKSVASELFDLCVVSNSLLDIELKRWEDTCGDGCCYTEGMDVFLNGEQLDVQNAEDSVNALTAILNKLGYKFEINYR